MIAEEIDEKYRRKQKLPSLKKFESRDYYAYMQWEKMETLGTPPWARYQHSMHYYKPLNSICVFGGKGDTAENDILNDLFLLRMDKLLWIKVEVKGMDVGRRANSASWIVQDKLIVFGGIKENMNFSNDTFVFELDPENVERLVQFEEKEKERESIEDEVYKLQLKMGF